MYHPPYLYNCYFFDYIVSSGCNSDSGAVSFISCEIIFDNRHYFFYRYLCCGVSEYLYGISLYNDCIVMILPFLFFSGCIVLLPIIGSTSVLLRFSISLIFSIAFITSFEKVLLLPSITESIVVFILGVISGLPFLIMQIAWSNLAESLDMSRGVSIGGTLHPFSEWVESTSSSVVGWLFCYFFLVQGAGFEYFITMYARLNKDPLLNVTDVIRYLWEMLPSLLSIYQGYFMTYGWIFGVFLIIELYFASLSRSLQQIPLHELSFLFKVIFLISLGLGGYVF